MRRCRPAAVHRDAGGCVRVRMPPVPQGCVRRRQRACPCAARPPRSAPAPTGRANPGAVLRAASPYPASGCHRPPPHREARLPTAGRQMRFHQRTESRTAASGHSAWVWGVTTSGRLRSTQFEMLTPTSRSQNCRGGSVPVPAGGSQSIVSGTPEDLSAFRHGPAASSSGSTPR